MKINGATAVIKTLEELKVKNIFGYPGGAVLPLYDALLNSHITHILARSEQAACHAAAGISKTSDEIGVCFATSGPGATNLVTGIATAFADSVPLIIITGQVPTFMVGTDAFQEVDTTGITLPIVKYSYLVKKASDIPQIITDAFHIAGTGRKGPVLIDIPKDIQTEEFEYKKPKEPNLKGYKPNYFPNKKQLVRVWESISKSKRPLILIGGGLVFSNASEDLLKILEKAPMPVISTLMGKGFRHIYKNSFGMIGLHGNAAANYAATNCDLLISLGARFGDRATINSESFAKKAKIIHVDIDPAEIDKNIECNTPVVSDLKNFLKELLPIVEELNFDIWIDRIKEINEKYPTTYIKDGSLKPQEVLEKINKYIDENTYVTTEVGQHQMWAAQFLKMKGPGKFITSGGLGTMGFGLPAALGIGVNDKNKKIIVISGDGSFQMNFAELATASEQDLNLKIFLFNNSSLSLVKQLQYFSQNKRYSGIKFKKNPDFCKLATAYPGVNAFKINSPKEIDKVLKEAFSTEGTVLVECVVSNEEKVYPVANSSKGIEEMIYLNDEIIKLKEK